MRTLLIGLALAAGMGLGVTGLLALSWYLAGKSHPESNDPNWDTSD